jgi:hypothetical protein
MRLIFVSMLTRLNIETPQIEIALFFHANAQADIQSRGRDLGCCRNVNDTRCGGLSSFSSYVDCATVDSCAVETVNRVTADFFMPNVCYVQRFLHCLAAKHDCASF